LWVVLAKSTSLKGVFVSNKRFLPSNFKF